MIPNDLALARVEAAITEATSMAQVPTVARWARTPPRNSEAPARTPMTKMTMRALRRGGIGMMAAGSTPTGRGIPVAGLWSVATAAGRA